MSVIEKTNSFVEGRGLNDVLKDKSTTEQYSVITGRTYVTDSTLEEDNAEWFVPGGLFMSNNINNENDGSKNDDVTTEQTPEPTPEPEPTSEPTPEPELDDNTQNSEVDVESD